MRLKVALFYSSPGYLLTNPLDLMSCFFSLPFPGDPHTMEGSAEIYLQPLEWCFHCPSTHGLIKIQNTDVSFLFLGNAFFLFHLHENLFEFLTSTSLVHIPLFYPHSSSNLSETFNFLDKNCRGVRVNDCLKGHCADDTYPPCWHSPQRVRLLYQPGATL